MKRGFQFLASYPSRMAWRLESASHSDGMDSHRKDRQWGDDGASLVSGDGENRCSSRICWGSEVVASHKESDRPVIASTRTIRATVSLRTETEVLAFIGLGSASPVVRTSLGSGRCWAGIVRRVRVAPIQCLIQGNLLAKAQLPAAPALGGLVSVAAACMATGVTAILAEVAVGAGMLPPGSARPAAGDVNPAQPAELHKTRVMLSRFLMHGTHSPPNAFGLDRLHHPKGLLLTREDKEALFPGQAGGGPRPVACGRSMRPILRNINKKCACDLNYRPVLRMSPLRASPLRIAAKAPSARVLGLADIRAIWI